MRLKHWLALLALGAMLYVASVLLQSYRKEIKTPQAERVAPQDRVLPPESYLTDGWETCGWCDRDFVVYWTDGETVPKYCPLCSGRLGFEPQK